MSLAECPDFVNRKWKNLAPWENSFSYERAIWENKS